MEKLVLFLEEIHILLNSCSFLSVNPLPVKFQQVLQLYVLDLELNTLINLLLTLLHNLLNILQIHTQPTHLVLLPQDRVFFL